MTSHNLYVKQNKINEEYEFKEKKVYDFIKRCLDILLSLLSIILLSPFFVILIVIIKFSSDGPVFYIHKRVGKNGKEIGIYKLRSMVVDADNLEKYFNAEQKKEYEKNFKLNDDPRITKIGKFMRKTSLDELPQLLNILKGDISTVGPRPVTAEEICTYSPDGQKLLLSIKPGLTGFWAANGRSSTTYKERQKMELFYVENRSLLLDIKIIFQTIISVFKGEGAK